MASRQRRASIWASTMAALLLMAPTSVTAEPSGATSEPAVSQGPGLVLITCGGRAYPGMGIDAPADVLDGATPEAEVLRAIIDRYAAEFPGSGAWPWRIAGQDATGILFLARTDDLGPPGWVSADAVATEVGWRPGGIGQCDPRLTPGLAQGPAGWWLDPAAGLPGPDTMVLHVLLREQACASGRSAEGRVGTPVIAMTPTSAIITIGVFPAPGQAQSCQGNPATPSVVFLPEPLGERQLLDGGRTPPGPPTDPDR